MMFSSLKHSRPCKAPVITAESVATGTASASQGATACSSGRNSSSILKVLSKKIDGQEVQNEPAQRSETEIDEDCRPEGIGTLSCAQVSPHRNPLCGRATEAEIKKAKVSK